MLAVVVVPHGGQKGCAVIAEGTGEKASSTGRTCVRTPRYHFLPTSIVIIWKNHQNEDGEFFFSSGITKS
jgi:hypothetical protein